jgi:hypothetical protein
MTTYQTPFQRALSDEPLRSGDKEYFAAQHQSELHQLLLATFLDCQASNAMKRSDLSKKSGHSPAVVTRVLSEPSNYEASTVAVLMAAMGYRITVGRERITLDGERLNHVPPIQRMIERAGMDSHGTDNNLSIRNPMVTSGAASPQWLTTP